MIIKLNNGANAPQYQTEGAVGFDFEAIEDVEIKDGCVGLIDTGVVCKVPRGCMLMLAPRSSTYKKHGLILANSIGVIDQDYCGNDDTIKFQYLNVTDSNVTIKKGERIGQGVIVQIKKEKLHVVDSMFSNNRGGFGTTN